MDLSIQSVVSPCFIELVLICLDLGWLTGDLIAGITVALVLVPQSMSYAIVRTDISGS
jgi:MFS superfamily sulfate permease-like transporter